jgi:hypothetical protein
MAQHQQPNTPVRRRGTRFRLLSVLCLGVGLVLGVPAGRSWLAARRLQNEGIEVPARVVGIDRRTTAGGETSHTLTVRFRPPGSTDEHADQQKRFDVSDRLYQDFQARRPLSVRYLPDDPDSAILEPDADALGKLLLAATVFLLGLVLSVLAFRNRSPA